jgi:hypothetical protein
MPLTVPNPVNQTTPHNYVINDAWNGETGFYISNTVNGNAANSTIYASADSGALQIFKLATLNAGFGIIGSQDGVVYCDDRLVITGSGATVFSNDNGTTEVARINNGLMVGTTTDPGAGFVNVPSAGGYKINGISTAMEYQNSSVTSQSPAAVDVYLTGSNITVGAGDFKAKGQYKCLFDVVKSAGTGGIVITVRIGTLGAIGDTSRMTFTFPAGTSVADTGTMEVVVNWRTVGSGTSAVIAGLCRAQKNVITAAGLWGDTSAAKTIVGAVSAGFASNTATAIGLSFNGGTAFAGTVTTVQASLLQ